MSSPDPRNRRRLRNLLQNPRLQYRYGFYFFGFAVVAAVLNQAMLVVSFRRLLSNALATSNVDPVDLATAVGGPLESLALRITLLYPVLGVVCFAFGIWITHRFVGPMVPLRRMIGQITRGDYAARVHLREHDELTELATDLNEMAAALHQRHGSGEKLAA